MSDQTTAVLVWTALAVVTIGNILLLVLTVMSLVHSKQEKTRLRTENANLRERVDGYESDGLVDALSRERAWELDVRDADQRVVHAEARCTVTAVTYKDASKVTRNVLYVTRLPEG
jgi:hypothetical protein